jgi:hypothetical protein
MTNGSSKTDCLAALAIRKQTILAQYHHIGQYLRRPTT